MSILSERYSSPEMSRLFEPENKARLWRQIWYQLATVQEELGVSITEDQIHELENNLTSIDLDRVKTIEAELKHDVMAHLKHFAECAPLAAPILHLGATSCFVTDNADSILYRKALLLIHAKLTRVIEALADKTRAWSDIACLGYTHFQPAQPTTLGKRASLWLQDLINDYWDLDRYLDHMKCRGAKGTTGTQASFLELFNNDVDKVKQLDKKLARKFGFDQPVAVSGQTISRRLEAKMADILAGIAISLCKLGSDIRLLSHTGELREGFSKNQVGSSAMPYKRNPMQAERLCSLSRAITKYRDMITDTAMNQWLERSLDDSAIRRIALPDQFLAADGALRLALKLIEGLEPDLDVINQRLASEGPFLAVERLLIRGVEQGFDRQKLHKKLRDYAIFAKDSGDPDPAGHFMRLIETDKELKVAEWNFNWDVSEMIGLASQQAKEYVSMYYTPIYLDALDLEDSKRRLEAETPISWEVVKEELNLDGLEN